MWILNRNLWVRIWQENFQISFLLAPHQTFTTLLCPIASNSLKDARNMHQLGIRQKWWKSVGNDKSSRGCFRVLQSSKCIFGIKWRGNEKKSYFLSPEVRNRQKRSNIEYLRKIERYYSMTALLSKAHIMKADSKIPLHSMSLMSLVTIKISWKCRLRRFFLITSAFLLSRILKLERSTFLSVDEIPMRKSLYCVRALSLKFIII